MGRFIKTFIFFIYFILSLFLQQDNTFAFDNIGQNSSVQYYISTTKSENYFINNKKEEYYVIAKNNNRTEILNKTNKNQNFCFGSFDKAIIDFVILVNSVINNLIYPTCISHNISPNLRNAIYTRAP